MVKETIPLVVEDGSPQFMMNVEFTEDVNMKFEVYEVQSHDDDKRPVDLEMYLTGSIKWDGCSHLWFGNKKDEIYQDGYIHLCGKYFWDLHVKLMKEIWEYAEKNLVREDY